MPFLGGRGQSSRGYFGFASTPDAPTSLSSVAGNGQLIISFTPPAFNGGLEITNYEWSVNAGSTWTAVSPADAVSPVTIGPLSNGTPYTVYLRAVNALGGGAASLPVSTNTTPFTIPSAPTIGTVTTTINSPGTVSTPTLSSQDCNNANFSWSNPGASGAALSVPFTAGFDGGNTVIRYEYSTDNGSTYKNANTLSSPINITTISSSSASLAANTEYAIRIRAVNNAGNGTQSNASSKTTPAAVTSYTIRLYNNRGTETLTDTITGNTTGTYSRSHFKIQADWSVTVAAVNSNGTGSYSAESDAATGWTYSAYDADYATSRQLSTTSGCNGCGTRTYYEDGTVNRTCNQWTRTNTGSGACTSETGLACTFDTNNNEAESTTWSGNQRDFSACSPTWAYVSPEANLTVTINGVTYTANVFGYSDGSSAGCGTCQVNEWDLQSCTISGTTTYRVVNQRCEFVAFC